MSVTFESSRFGSLEIDAGAVIEFPTGLIGLAGARYALIAPDPDASFTWLHSLDDPDVALPVTDPWLHFGQYVVELSDADAARVGAEDPSALDVWVTIRAASDPVRFSCNLRAPIVVWNGRGHQVINEAQDAPVRAALFPDSSAVQATQPRTRPFQSGFQGGTHPCSSSPASQARRSCSATTSSST